jgi:hypothetical protein
MTESPENITSKRTPIINNERRKITNTCIQCKNEIPQGAKLCTNCGSYQSKFKNHVKYAAIVVGFLAALGTALMHSVSLFPIVQTILFPNPDIEVIGFKSNQRLIIANKGNHELFITHVHYEAENIPYIEIAKELLSVVQDKPKENLKLENDFVLDFFDTNEDVGVIIKPGQVIKHNFKKDIPEGMSFVHGRKKEDWHQIIFIAGLNKKSSCIRPIFFSNNDRRFKQIQKSLSDDLNTFAGKATICAFSPQLDKIVEFPFEITGTVVINKNEKCIEKIERWINPRRGHVEDLK